jgi:adenylate cyclase
MRMPGQVIASELLATYLGTDAGARVHAGAVTRGSVENLRAVIWLADIGGLTAISEAAPGTLLIDPLNDLFETLTYALCERGGRVLKFIGDAMLVTFSFVEAGAETCGRAIEAQRKLEAMNWNRAAAWLAARLTGSGQVWG